MLTHYILFSFICVVGLSAEDQMQSGYECECEYDDDDTTDMDLLLFEGKLDIDDVYNVI